MRFDGRNPSKQKRHPQTVPPNAASAASFNPLLKHALRSTALSGFGIADGTLRHLLPDLTRNERTVAGVWLAGRIYPAKLAAFIDFMPLHLPAELR
ncbi:hypothetical protein [Xanthobacter sp. KR7-65]|uniref:hypothetical protein n=1 Tax=Xanthobacter sp. KR7-65 TaxID=3156612 RepID=UPI0032B4C5CB